VLRLLGLLLPLSLDTFAVAAALAAAGLPSSQRLRVSLVLTGFEAAMPLVGIGAGHAVGRALGSLADYLAGALLVGLSANAALGWWWADPVAALVIAAIAVREGRDAWRGRPR